MGEQSLYITPRTLLGIIRTAQAHAKCRFSKLVDQGDIDEAIRLIEACRDSFNDQLEKDKRNVFGQTTSQHQVISEIFKIISGLCRTSENKKILGVDAEAAVKKKGYTGEDF